MRSQEYFRREFSGNMIWRTSGPMKNQATNPGWTDLRPVYHRKDDRIRAHVLLCWLALLLIRTMEIRTSRTWFRMLPLLQSIHVGRFEGKAGVTMQTTELSSEQLQLFRDLKIQPPPHYLEITHASNRTPKE
mgnify:CR=1 FL=1